MSKTSLNVPILQHVFHPSDFSPASETAFAHALKAALIAQATLTIFHVSPDRKENWTEFPGVRQTLERWGILPKDSPRSAVPELGIKIKKVVAQDKNPVKAVLGYLEHHPNDMIVLATQQDKGRAQWLENSVAKPVARKSRQMTLFIPAGVEGFVSLKDGTVSLKHILIPVAPVPKAAALRSKPPSGSRSGSTAPPVGSLSFMWVTRARCRRSAVRTCQDGSGRRCRRRATSRR